MNNFHECRAATTPSSSVRRMWAALVGRVARISTNETLVARRGFIVPRPESAARLEAIGATFVSGYNLAVGSCELHPLVESLTGYPIEDAGFAYEGTAMGIAIADWITPGRRMFDAYVAGPAHGHEYMAWVGLGWALARLPVAPQQALMRYRNLNCWLALDGYGFHEGYFNWPARLVRQRRPPRLTPGAHRVFDQGLGRSLWFVRGADAGLVAQAIATFAPERRADLWSGVGLAAAYAGGCGKADLLALLAKCGAHAPSLAQGVVFAAEARRRAGNIVPHVELACRTVLGADALACADLAAATRPAGRHALEDYQQWRVAIQRAAIAVAPHLAHQSNREHVCPSSELG